MAQAQRQAQQVISIFRGVMMSLGNYCEFRGWHLSETEVATDEGYLIETLNTPPNTADYQGEVSWLPKEVMEQLFVGAIDLDFDQVKELNQKSYYLTVGVKALGESDGIAVFRPKGGYLVIGENENCRRFNFVAVTPDHCV